MSSSTTVACARCGALNGADFGSCIRCNQPLVRAEAADRATRRVPAPLRRSSLEGPGAEPLFGRWHATELPLTKLLIFINLVVFAGHLIGALERTQSFATIFTGGGGIDALRYGGLLVGWVPELAVMGLPPEMVRAEPWRLLSACFVHFGVLHIGMNMLSLVYLARVAEPAFGSIRFVILYTLTGIAGFGVNVVLFQLTGIGGGTTAGASGAVFGVMGMMLGYYLRRRDPLWKAWFGQVIVMSLLFTLLIRSVNHSAHLGGLISGVVLGAAFAGSASMPSRLWQRALASVCVLAVLGSLTASRLSPYYRALSQAAPVALHAPPHSRPSDEKPA